MTTDTPLDPTAIKAEHRSVNGYCVGCFVERPMGDAVTHPCQTYRLAADLAAAREAKFMCQTHMCGACGGCKAARIRDENSQLHEQLQRVKRLGALWQASMLVPRQECGRDLLEVLAGEPA